MFPKNASRSRQERKVCDMGLGDFFRKWAKVAESVDFTGFVVILWKAWIFLISQKLIERYVLDSSQKPRELRRRIFEVRRYIYMVEWERGA